MTGAALRLSRGLRGNGQAQGLLITWWGLVAFCAVSPISIAATNMAWVVAVLGVLYQSRSREVLAGGLVQRTDLDAPLLCFVLSTVLSVFLSLDMGASIAEARSLGLMVIVYLFAWRARSAGERQTLFRILLVSSCVAALYGWVQFLTGWDLLGHYRPETRKVGGFFGLHLTYGEYLSMVICTGAGILLWRDASRTERLGNTLALGWMASALVLSGSKGALLGLAVGLSLVFALRGRKAFASFVIVGFLLCFVLDVLLLHRLWANLVALFQVDAQQSIGPAASNTHRLCMWWTGLWISLEHFLYGVGLNAVERIYPVFRHPLAIEPNQWHLHNNFVQLGVTGGMLGLAAFLYIFLVVFRLGSFLCRAEGEGFDRGMAAGVLGASAAFLVAGFTEYNWGDSEVLMLLYLLSGLLCSCGRRGEEAARAPAPGASLEVVPEGMGAARRSITARTSQTWVLVLLAAGLCCLAFLFVPAVCSLRMRVWEGLLGIFVLLLALWGWDRREEVPVWQTQLCGGLALCLGYHFTQGLWKGEKWLGGAAEWTFWLAVVGSAALCLLTLLLFKGYREKGSPAILVDLAGIGALLTWSVIAFVTYGLLWMAGWKELLSGPPYLPLLLLAPLAAALYSGFRFAYWGGRMQRALLAALALCTLIHVFR